MEFFFSRMISQLGPYLIIKSMPMKKGKINCPQICSWVAGVRVQFTTNSTTEPLRNPGKFMDSGMSQGKIREYLNEKCVVTLMFRLSLFKLII